MKWLGLTGKMGAGKDHLFDRLVEIDPRFERVSFADAVRLDLEDTLGTHSIDAIWDKPYPEDIRKLLQWWGTDLRRSQDTDYWLKAAEQWATNAQADGNIPVFTDVRFPNEADMIRSHGGFIIRVVAPPHIRSTRLSGALPDHQSETAMDNYPVNMSLESVEGTRYETPVGYIADLARI